MTFDDLELLYVRILALFRRIRETTTAKPLKMDPYCQRQIIVVE